MLLRSFATVLALVGAVRGLLTEVTIFDPPANYTIPRTLYARTLLLNEIDPQTGNNVLLATWENYLPDNDPFPYFPIFQSFDLGETWSERSRVYDQVNGWGLRYQPFLYELEEDLGDYPAGTVLIAGNSIPQNLSHTQIDLYASRDKGYTWEFVSRIASGGEAIPDNGLTPVWEPFLMVYEGQMICYYSDQRNPAHGQQLSHQTSRNLIEWGPVVTDVAYSNYTFRPGMTTVSHLPNGSYIITYEFYGAPQAAFAVYYRISENPLEFNSAPGYVIDANGTIPVSSPYNIWTPAGGPHGTIVVSCGTLGQVFVNRELGAVDAWEQVPTPESVSYTRNLRVLPNPNQILITGAGVLGGTANKVTTSSIQLSVGGGWW